jgi:hypothetical protein
VNRLRAAALVAITVLIIAATLTSFAESYRALYEWALGHGLAGIWAVIWPLQVDVFIAVGELALFVALADGWAVRSRAAAWTVTALGLAASVAGNVGHVASADWASRATAAVPPLAAAAALAVGLGVLKRVVAARARADETAPGSEVVVEDPADEPEADTDDADVALEPDSVADAAYVPPDGIAAATAGLRATLAVGNPYTINQLQTKFHVTRAEATRVRRTVLAETNGHA